MSDSGWFMVSSSFLRLSIITVVALTRAASGLSAQPCARLPVSRIVASTHDDGHVPSSAIDNDLGTWWSGYGIGANITADLGSLQSMCGINIAWHNWAARQNRFAIDVSLDGVTFTNVFRAISTGMRGLESYTFAPAWARFVRTTVNGNTQNDWASITELQPLGAPAASMDYANVCVTAIDDRLATRWPTDADEGVEHFEYFLTRSPAAVGECATTQSSIDVPRIYAESRQLIPRTPTSGRHTMFGDAYPLRKVDSSERIYFGIKGFSAGGLPFSRGGLSWRFKNLNSRIRCALKTSPSV